MTGLHMGRGRARGKDRAIQARAGQLTVRNRQLPQELPIGVCLGKTTAERQSQVSCAWLDLLQQVNKAWQGRIECWQDASTNEHGLTSHGVQPLHMQLSYLRAKCQS